MSYAIAYYRTFHACEQSCCPMYGCNGELKIDPYILKDQSLNLINFELKIYKDHPYPHHTSWTYHGCGCHGENQEQAWGHSGRQTCSSLGIEPFEVLWIVKNWPLVVELLDDVDLQGKWESFARRILLRVEIIASVKNDFAIVKVRIRHKEISMLNFSLL